MRSILETFAYGNMSPNAQPCKDNPLYGDAMRALSHSEEKLLEKLNEEETATFKKYIAAQDAVKQLTAAYNWVDGYKFGLLLTATAFVTSEP